MFGDETTPHSRIDPVAALRAGDEAAFTVLVAEHQASMLRIARRFVRTPATAEEVVQEAWMAALNGLDRFEGRSSLKTWLFRILANIARSRGKREARSMTFSELAGREVAIDEVAVDGRYFYGTDGVEPGHWATREPRRWGSSAELRLLDRELRAEIDRAVEGLPEAQRLVVSLRDIEGWSSAEVRNALEISETNQRVLLHRGRTKVRRALNDYLRGEAP